MSINDSTEEIKKENEGMKTRLWFKVLIVLYVENNKFSFLSF